jgi:hypothetical protein
MARPANVVENVDMPSPLESDLGRPTNRSLDQFTYLEHHSRRSIVDHPISPDAHSDVCDPVRFAI